MTATSHSRVSDPASHWIPPAVAVSLLAAASALDLFRPFSIGYSIFYLAPVLYSGWALRGRVEFLFNVAVLACAFLVPVLRSGMGSLGSINRFMGAAVGLLVVGLLQERRRYADALALAKAELESTVKARTAELERLNQEHQRAIAIKDQFLSKISHEIRTPLNGILGMAELLGESAAHGDQASTIRDLRTSAQVLRSMVDDVLDFSRLQAGRLQLREAPFSLRTTIAEVVAMVRTDAARNGIDVISDLPDETWDNVVGDQVRIRQILTNLLGNAIKFTERGFIRVGVQPLDAPPGADFLQFRFAVQDTGIGISEQAQARVFEKFSQLDASTTRRYGGSGLGLSICKNLVTLMRGQIGVNSTPGSGSTFWFTLVLRLANANRMGTDGATAAMVPEPAPPQALHGRQVAIVEDNAINRTLLARFLAKLGCHVVAFASGPGLLHAAATTRFDVVLMDLQMPEMDGLETTRALRRCEAPGAPRTVVIAVTASILEQDRDACLAAGMDDYLAKPVSFDDLGKTLAKWSTAQHSSVTNAATSAG